MVKLLLTRNPDNDENIPVVLDTPDIDVTAVRIFRKSVEGNAYALNADVTFDTSKPLPKSGQERQLEVVLSVLTAGHVANMMDGMYIKSVSELEKVWDMATTSGGKGQIHAVFVKTVLHDPSDF